MMEILSAIIGALIGSITSAFFTLYYSLWEQKRRRQLETTMSLYQEFHSSNMINNRIKTDSLLKQKITNNISYMELYDELSIEDWLPISSLLHFFEKISTYHENGYLDNKLVKAFFSTYFSYYYDTFLKKMNEISKQKSEKEHIILAVDELSGWLYNSNEKIYSKIK